MGILETLILLLFFIFLKVFSIVKKGPTKLVPSKSLRRNNLFNSSPMQDPKSWIHDQIQYESNAMEFIDNMFLGPISYSSYNKHLKESEILNQVYNKHLNQKNDSKVKASRIIDEIFNKF